MHRIWWPYSTQRPWSKNIEINPQKRWEIWNKHTLSKVYLLLIWILLNCFALEWNWMSSLSCSMETGPLISAFECWLIANRLPLIHLLIAITNRYVPIASTITHEPIVRPYVNIVNWKAMAMPKPNGFFQSNGNLQQIPETLKIRNFKWFDLFVLPHQIYQFKNLISDIGRKVFAVDVKGPK